MAQCGQANGYSGSRTTHGALFLLRKEFLPLLLAAAVWGSEWRGQRVKFKCDNSTVVATLERRTSRVALLMHLLRALHYVSAYFSFTWQVVHISGKSDTIADALSRDNAKKHSLCVHSWNSGSSGTLCFSFITGNRLELSRLEIAAQRFFFSGLAPSTKRVYQSGQSSYIRFCNSDLRSFTG